MIRLSSTFVVFGEEKIQILAGGMFGIDILSDAIVKLKLHVKNGIKRIMLKVCLFGRAAHERCRVRRCFLFKVTTGIQN